MYKVIKPFIDRDETEYKVGDSCPKKGIEADEERIGALRDGNNFYKVPFIEEVKSPKTTKKN